MKEYIDGQSAAANDPGMTAEDQEAIEKMFSKNKPIITDEERRRLVLDAQNQEEKLREMGIEPEDNDE